MKRSVVAAIASLAPLVALPAAAHADAPPALLPPVVTLTSDDSSITATITNPNEPRVISGYTLTCTLTLGGPSTNGTVWPFEDPDPHGGTPTDPSSDTTRYPHAGQTVTITRDGLAQGQYRLDGQCGQLSNRGGGWLWAAGASSERVEYEIWVGPQPQQPSGLLGSLGL